MQNQIIKKLDPTEKSFRSFRRACKSMATQKAYKLALDLFMSHAGYTSYDKLVQTPVAKIKSDNERFLIFESKIRIHSNLSKWFNSPFNFRYYYNNRDALRPYYSQ